MADSGQSRPSPLNQVTVVDLSDGSASDQHLNESDYHEAKHITCVPTKSGSERGHRPNSDEIHFTSRPNSSKSDAIDEADAKIIEACTAAPSAAEVEVSVHLLEKDGMHVKPIEFTNFTFARAKGQVNQSSQARPPSSFERSNQEHQIAALCDNKAPSRGLRDVFTWLSSWLTLNLQAPADILREVSPQDQKAPQSSHTPTSTGPHYNKPAVQRHKQPRVSSSSAQSRAQPTDRSQQPSKASVEVPATQDGIVTDTTNATAPSGLQSGSDEEEIFNITGTTPANSAVATIAHESPDLPGAGQQDMEAKVESHTRSKVSLVESVDARIPDVVVQEELPDQAHQHLEPQAGNLNKSAETRSANFKDQPSDKVHRPPAAEQTAALEPHHSVNSSLLPDTACSVQHPPTPADTLPPSRSGHQDALRGVSARSGQPRVTKKKSKPTPSGSAPHRTTAKPKSNSSSYTAAELYQLADFMKEQERVQEKEEWVRGLAAKQAELEKVNQQKLNLEAECTELRASLTNRDERLKKIVKAFTGLGTDLKTLQAHRRDYDDDWEEANAMLSELRPTLTGLVTEVDVLIAREPGVRLLVREKADLMRRLDEVTKTLVQERERQAFFDQRLQDSQTAQKSAEEMLTACLGKMSKQLSEFKVLAERDTSSQSTSLRELLKLVKKEDAILASHVQTSGSDFKKMKAFMEQLSEGLVRRAPQFQHVLTVFIAFRSTLATSSQSIRQLLLHTPTWNERLSRF
jgi:hypothetical protein